MALRSPITRVLRASARQGYYNPVKKSEKVEVNDGAADGGIATSKDMSPVAQELRFHRGFIKDLHAKKQAMKTMSKDEFLKFSEEYDQSKGTKLVKAPTTIEELPQSDQDWLAGKDETHPLKFHPFVMKRAKAMLAGTWIPAVQRWDGHLNEFGQPMNDPQSWIDYINETKWEYFDDVCELVPRIAGSRHPLTLGVLKAILGGMLRCDRQNPEKVGNHALAMIDLMYDFEFSHKCKCDEETHNMLLEATVKMGDWRFSYMVEDLIQAKGMKCDEALIAKADEHARYAYEKGYLLPPSMQGKDLADFFKIDTRGGVGAYIPLPDGMSKGYEMWEIYEEQKKAGTFVPAIGTPAWDEYAKAHPEAKKLDPHAARKAFQDDFKHFTVHSLAN